MEVVVFFAALVGAGVGAYGGLTVERLRGRHELDIRRREDIKEGLLALNEEAAEALRVCADLERADHWPALYGDDWRMVRAKQLPGRAADVLVAWSRVEVLLAGPSALGERVGEYFDVLVAPDGEPQAGEGGRLQRAAAAHAALREAIRDQLGGDGATAGWQQLARRIFSPRD